MQTVYAITGYTESRCSTEPEVGGDQPHAESIVVYASLLSCRGPEGYAWASTTDTLYPQEKTQQWSLTWTDRRDSPPVHRGDPLIQAHPLFIVLRDGQHGGRVRIYMCVC